MIIRGAGDSLRIDIELFDLPKQKVAKSSKAYMELTLHTTYFSSETKTKDLNEDTGGWTEAKYNRYLKSVRTRDLSCITVTWEDTAQQFKLDLEYAGVGWPMYYFFKSEKLALIIGNIIWHYSLGLAFLEHLKVYEDYMKEQETDSPSVQTDVEQ